MAISTALSIAVSGLAVTQRETDTVAMNVARSQQAGYTRREMVVADYVGLSGTIGLKGTVQRQIDLELQRQVLQATPSTTYAEVSERFAARLDQMMGVPGEAGSLASNFSQFMEKLQALASTPDSLTDRISAVNQARTLASSLNQYSADIQQMRTEAEQSIADGVSRVNELLRTVERLNEGIVSARNAGQDATSLEDARDLAVKEMATWIDVQTRVGANGQMTVFSRSGLTLVDSSAITLAFDKQGTLSPDSLYDLDPAKRGVGTITVQTNGAPSVDLISGGLIRSGKLAAYVEARDETLVRAQNQMDALAASLADAMGGKTVVGTPVTTGTEDGLEVDLAALKTGNVVTFDYVDTASGQTRTVSFIWVDRADTLPLGNDATARSDDTVHGIDFSAGMASVVTQVQAALGSAFTVSNPAGSTLQILDDGAANTVDVAALTARISLTAVTDGELGFPLFTDGRGGPVFTDSLDIAPQRRGFSSRIAVNSDILADPGKLVQWRTSPATYAGDPARPNELISRLRDTAFDFGPATGVVAGNTTFRSTLDGFANAVVSHWGAAAEDAASAVDAQSLVQNNLEARFNDTASVNIDQEMARLIQLQSAYAANARVLQVAQEMLDALLRT